MPFAALEDQRNKEKEYCLRVEDDDPAERVPLSPGQYFWRHRDHNDVAHETAYLGAAAFLTRIQALFENDRRTLGERLTTGKNMAEN
mmetsp:Transcript_39452/g.45899  ORF Transcript_39452/g.45899 Transcript_39452/m.45899 type:complete len:87 (-) Transcript_39452:629-889(-)